MVELSDLEAVLGHHFTHPEILEQALTHGSVRHEQQIGDSPETAPINIDNERLEFLGDAIVGMLVAEQLYRRYPELHEGELTRLRAALVSRKHLGVVGAALQLGAYLRLGRAEERNGGRKKAVLLANCMEALIGALYLEAGLEVAAAFVQSTVTEPYLDELRGEMRENRAIGDHKTALQEMLQARRAGQPEYTLKAESGPDHRKRFVVEVRVDHGADSAKGLGEGSTKKRAEQEAARMLYEQLKARAGEKQAPPASSHQPEQPETTAASERPLPLASSSKKSRLPRGAEANSRQPLQEPASQSSGALNTGQEVQPGQVLAGRHAQPPSNTAAGKNLL